jgi:hypothetical protein
MGKGGNHLRQQDGVEEMERGRLYSRCAVYENLNFYQTADPNEYPLAPDIA